MQFVKSSAFVEAIQFTGTNFNEVLSWLRAQDTSQGRKTARLAIATLEESSQNGTRYMILGDLFGESRNGVIQPTDYILMGRYGLEHQTAAQFEALYKPSTDVGIGASTSTKRANAAG